MRENYDFSGWVTKNNLVCSDGRTIRENAFAHNDGKRVPLVWNHVHSSTAAVLGHVDLENRKAGVFGYGCFNHTQSGKDAKEMVLHKDVDSLSICANHIKQDNGNVLHGEIREVSLVLAGANPGAKIQYLMHSDDSDDYLDDEYEARIFTGCSISLEHSDAKNKKKKNIEENSADEDVEEIEENSADEDVEEIEENSADEDVETDNKKDGKKKMKKSNDKEFEHSDEIEENEKNGKNEKTVQDVIDTMNEEQKTVLYGLVGSIAEANDKQNGGDNMKHNVFENYQNGETNVNSEDEVLMHSDMVDAIFKDARRLGSLGDSVLQHAAEYGIENIDYLFPEAKPVDGYEPGFLNHKPDEWVQEVINGVKKIPFSRIMSIFADIKTEDARAKGYMTKGKLKKEEVFGLLKRKTTPTTIYKKQKMDRDDLLDITTFDVVTWLKGEMRMKLDEEIARAILFSDGRTNIDPDKIAEENVRPIVSEDSLFAITKTIIPKSGESLSHAIIDGMMRAFNEYEGSGNVTFFTSNAVVTEMRLMEDGQNRRLYKDDNEVALAMGVDKIVKVPAALIPDDVIGVALDLKDYGVGTDKGGEVGFFDDFDLDYNQQKYLIETRCSGALMKPFSAIVLKSGSNNVQNSNKDR